VRSVLTSGMTPDGSPMFAIVKRLFVREGDRVATNQLVAEIETDKACVEVPSPTAGVVIEVLCRPGDRVGPYDQIVRIEPDQPGPRPRE
jgi:pyruvate/2-oxoglutarate dehydrogenase complex dihydrolipoamide acyltransferase (E2) component